MAAEEVDRSGLPAWLLQAHTQLLRFQRKSERIVLASSPNMLATKRPVGRAYSRELCYAVDAPQQNDTLDTAPQTLQASERR